MLDIIFLCIFVLIIALSCSFFLQALFRNYLDTFVDILRPHVERLAVDPLVRVVILS